MDEDFPGDFPPRELGIPHKGQISPLSQNNGPLGKKKNYWESRRKEGRWRGEERRSEEQIKRCEQEELPGQNSKGKILKQETEAFLEGQRGLCANKGCSKG